MNRREFMAFSFRAGLGAVLVSGFGPLRWGTAVAQPGNPSRKFNPVGTPYPLVALPGKEPMGQVYDRPPNYETPTPRLLSRKIYPYTDNSAYYVRYREAEVPLITEQAFRLKVYGDRVEKPLTLSMADLRALPKVEIGAVGECNGLGRGLARPLIPGMPWTKGDVSCARWGGVRVSEVLKLAGVRSGVHNVYFRAAGRTVSLTKPDYVRGWPLDTVMSPDAILAYEMNGEAIPLWNGAPLRLVIGGTYAPGWVKQLVEIEVRSKHDPREWSGRPITANKLKVYSLLTEPADGTRLQVDQPVKVTGVAWDDGKGIQKVEVSLDDGKTWAAAELEKSYGKYVWRVWHATITPNKRGMQRVLTRAHQRPGPAHRLRQQLCADRHF